MALIKLLTTSPDTPYFRPTPLHVQVLKVEDQPRVVTWEFNENMARAATIKHNRVAVISDGHSLARVTLYEEFSSKMVEGKAYIIRGHTLRGQSPPFALNVGREATFFKSSTITVPEQLIEEAEAMIHPASPLKQVTECRDVKGFVSVEGEVVEINAVQPVRSGKDVIPMRRMILDQDTSRIQIKLWREAAVLEVSLGERVRVTHMKCSNTDYGLQLQSSNYTNIEKPKEELCFADIVGVMEPEEEGSSSGGAEPLLQVLTESGSILLINRATWQPFEERLTISKVKVEMSVEGRRITKMRLVNEA
ncbi:hypothetical protein KUCAC02_037001 [Chaenocephalus aceratus]|nr:hypothetical protein KUCAC02_037001 [Chaenocephalus aceratus]